MTYAFALVYKTGGDYCDGDALKVIGAIREREKRRPILLLTDSTRILIPGVFVMPLRKGWPGWWSKMELFAPWIGGDYLYFDLDTMLVGDLTPLHKAVEQRFPLIMRDVNRLNGLQSSIMYIPHRMKRGIWEAFNAQPHHWMDVYAKGGDQAFLEQVSRGRWRLWQDMAPGAVVSYKADVLPLGYVPRDAAVVAFHGRPRPREIDFKLPRREGDGD
jgi:hypothetical protein